MTSNKRKLLSKDGLMPHRSRGRLVICYSCHAPEENKCRTLRRLYSRRSDHFSAWVNGVNSARLRWGRGILSIPHRLRQFSIANPKQMFPLAEVALEAHAVGNLKR